MVTYESELMRSHTHARTQTDVKINMKNLDAVEADMHACESQTSINTPTHSDHVGLGVLMSARPKDQAACQINT